MYRVIYTHNSGDEHEGRGWQAGLEAGSRARRVQHGAGSTAVARGDRCRVDDGATPLRAKLRNRRAAGRHDRAHIEVDDRVEQLFGGVGDRAALHEVADVCNRIGLMKSGRLLVEAETSTLLEDSQGRYLIGTDRDGELDSLLDELGLVHSSAAGGGSRTSGGAGSTGGELARPGDDVTITISSGASRARLDRDGRWCRIFFMVPG